MEKINIGFAGFSDNSKEYIDAISKIEGLDFKGIYSQPNNEAEDIGNINQYKTYQDLLADVDVVCFFGEKIQRKTIADAIRAMKHVFVDDYTAILNDNIGYLCDLVDEAGVTAQVSMPKMHYWSIKEIIDTYKDIRYINFDKANCYIHQRADIDIYPEIVAVQKIADAEIVSLQCRKVPVLPKKSEMMQVNIEFINGVSAVINANPCAFYDWHELGIIADKNMALVDLRKREWHNLIYKTSTSEPIKELFNMDEVPFIERNEMSELLVSVRDKKEPFTSFKSIRNLQKCINMMDSETR